MGKFYFSVLGLIACLFFSCGKNEDGEKQRIRSATHETDDGQGKVCIHHEGSKEKGATQSSYASCIESTG